MYLDNNLLINNFNFNYIHIYENNMKKITILTNYKST